MQEILSKKDIGERIKNLRVHHNLSQAFIAEILNLSRSNYSQIELGNQYPSFNTLHTVARYYGKSYDWLLDGISMENSKSCSSKETDAIIKALESSLKSFTNSVKQLEQELHQLKATKAKIKL